VQSELAHTLEDGVIMNVQVLHTAERITCNNLSGKKSIDYKKIHREFDKTEFLEFTLTIGCPVQCQKYCPQEILLKNYCGHSPRLLSFDDFKKILNKIPKNVCIDFAGFSEPFSNPDFVKMAEYAYDNGYELMVYTTLYGAKPSDIDRLLKLTYREFCLHLRDGHIVKFPSTPEYEHNIARIIEGIPNLTFSLMNELFETNNRENTTRGFRPKAKKVGYCSKLVTPQFILLPNGSIQLCCTDFGLKHTVGNLLEEEYDTIKRRFLARKGYYYSSCTFCSYCQPYAGTYALFRSNLRKTISKIAIFR
jgi:hypothetical protein